MSSIQRRSLKQLELADIALTACMQRREREFYLDVQLEGKISEHSVSYIFSCANNYDYFMSLDAQRVTVLEKMAYFVLN